MERGDELIFMSVIPLILFGLLYGIYRNRLGSRALVFKALSTAMAVMTGFYGAVSGGEVGGSVFRWIIVAGLICCMTADVLLVLYYAAVYLIACASVTG